MDGGASTPGPQVVRLTFDKPQSIRRIRLEFREDGQERVQEFALYATSENQAQRGVTPAVEFQPRWLDSGSGRSSSGACGCNSNRAPDRSRPSREAKDCVSSFHCTCLTPAPRKTPHFYDHIERIRDMRSSQIYRALDSVPNRFTLCQTISQSVRRIHFNGNSFESTVTVVLNGIGDGLFRGEVEPYLHRDDSNTAMSRLGGGRKYTK